MDKTRETVFQLLVPEILHHEGSQLRVEVAEEDDVAVAHLVEDTHQMTFSVGGSFGSLYRRDVRDVALVAYGVVVDEVAHLLDEAVVANGDVTQRGVVDARMFGEAR